MNLLNSGNNTFTADSLSPQLVLQLPWTHLFPLFRLGTYFRPGTGTICPRSINPALTCSPIHLNVPLFDNRSGYGAGSCLSDEAFEVTGPWHGAVPWWYSSRGTLAPRSPTSDWLRPFSDGKQSARHVSGKRKCLQRSSSDAHEQTHFSLHES